MEPSQLLLDVVKDVAELDNGTVTNPRVFIETYLERWIAAGETEGIVYLVQMIMSKHSLDDLDNASIHIGPLGKLTTTFRPLREGEVWLNKGDGNAHSLLQISPSVDRGILVGLLAGIFVFSAIEALWLA